MNSSFRAITLVVSFSAGLLGSVPPAQAEPSSACVQAANDVSQAVTKDPKKVLLIVEDALVINESCACEIVRAAIQSSGADAAMIQQIVQTGIAVAPGQAGMITECAAANGQPVAQTETTEDESGKNPTSRDSNGKNPSEKNPSGKNAIADSSSAKNPIMPEVDAEGSRAASGSGGPSLGNFAGNVRGVYLVYPAAGVITTPQATTEVHNDECCDGGHQQSVKATQSRRTRNIVPLSPSEAQAG